MNKEYLDKILNDHKNWLAGSGGCRANLRGANLRGADLRGANLCDADLCDADLRGANLRGADLCGADLCGADLRGANLRGADLRDADLRDADLRGANLRGANLRGADLRNCAGNRKNIMSVFVFNEYPVVYTNEYLQIGCERHQIDDWWDFDDTRILQMDGKTALKFWRNNKDLIKTIIESNPAEPTK